MEPRWQWPRSHYSPAGVTTWLSNPSQNDTTASDVKWELAGKNGIIAEISSHPLIVRMTCGCLWGLILFLLLASGCPLSFQVSQANWTWVMEWGEKQVVTVLVMSFYRGHNTRRSWKLFQGTWAVSQEGGKGGTLPPLWFVCGHHWPVPPTLVRWVTD